MLWVYVVVELGPLFYLALGAKDMAKAALRTDIIPLIGKTWHDLPRRQ